MPDKKPLEELFFTPVVSQFRAISDEDKTIKSKKYRTISFGNNFLGIKKTDYLNSSEVFLLEHKSAYNLAGLLYTSITNNDQDDLLHYFHTEELDWVAFLFSSLNRDNIEYQSFTPNNFSRDLPKNIEIVIGVDSGYNGTDVPNFYLILRYKFGQEDSFLTIDNYKFSKDDIELYIKNGRQIKILKSIIEDIVSRHFREQMKDFIKLYAVLSSMKIEKKYFVAVCLDLYNINRSITSTKNDKNLHTRIEKLIKESTGFISHGGDDVKCSLFIDFIIRYNFFRLDTIDINRDKVEELFVQKRPYQKVKEIFPAFYESQGIFEDYLNEQEDTFLKLNKFFQFVPGLPMPHP